MTLRPLSIAMSIFFVAAIPARLAAQTQDHTYSSADIEVGSRLYAQNCALCHGPNGDLVAAVNLRTGQFRRFLSDEDLRQVITSGVSAAGMPGFPLQPAELDGLVAFIRAGFDTEGTAVRIGNAALGQAIFAGKGGCTACHRVNGEGPLIGPDLSDIGAVRRPSALQGVLLDPTANLLPINRPVRIVTAEGETIRGRRLNEDTYTVQLIDQRGRLLSFDKADLREYEISRTSMMPSMEGRLTPEEISHLVAYLLSQRGR